MKRYAVTIVVLLLTALVLSGCSSVKSTQIQLPNYTNAPRFYDMCDTAPEGIVRLVSKKERRAFLGIPGTYTFTFEAMAEGKAVVVFARGYINHIYSFVLYSASVDSGENITFMPLGTVHFNTPPEDQRMAVDAFDRGTHEYSQRSYTESIETYTEAIDMYPDYVHAYWGRGISWLLMGDVNIAAADFEAVLRLDPDDTAAQALLDFLRL